MLPQTLLSSPLRMLELLPCGPAAPPPQQLRRSVSMQALSDGSGGVGGTEGGRSSGLRASCARRGGHGAMPRPPSLPAVQEHSAPVTDLPQQLALPPPPSPQQQAEAGPGRRPRRSQSDGALAELQRLPQAARQQRPLWLAQLLRQPRPPEGVGVCSAATLQDLACRQLCASLVAATPGSGGGGGQRLTPGLVAALQVELRFATSGLCSSSQSALCTWAFRVPPEEGWPLTGACPSLPPFSRHPPGSAHLPDEVASAIGRELAALVEAPAPTKLPLRALAKAAAAAGAGGGWAGVPDWARAWVERAQAGAEVRALPRSLGCILASLPAHS